MEWLEIVGKILSIISISLLFGGLIYILKRSLSKRIAWLIFYISILALCEIYGYLNRTNNLIVFWISSIAHFYFITFIFFRDIFKKKFILHCLLPILGSIFLILSAPKYGFFEEYISKANLIYDPLMILYALIYFGQLLSTNNKINQNHFRLFTGVLLFFGIDFFLALSSNFLINQSLYLVAGFWFLRGILLQYYYYTLIRYTQ